MKINTIELTNVRGFTHAKLEFQPGFNLIVGINGVGKTTVLESLRIVLSQILSEIKVPVITRENFKKSDINIDTDQLQVNANFSIDEIDNDFIYSKSAKDTFFKDVETNTSQNKELRRQTEAQQSIFAQMLIDEQKYSKGISVKNAIEVLIANKIIRDVDIMDSEAILKTLQNLEIKKNVSSNKESDVFEYTEFIQSFNNKELSEILTFINDKKSIEEDLQKIKREIENISKTLKNNSSIPSRYEGIQQEDIVEFKAPIIRKEQSNLIGIFFSTRRSLMVNQTSKVVKSKLFHAAAYVDTLSEVRSFNVKMFADWYNARKTLANENPENTKHNRVVNLIEDAIYTFLPGFSGLDIVKDEISGNLTFSIFKGSKKLLFSQLSDGERVILALVFDIARRLIITNIEVENPLHGEAIILIDELDLHLHPKWQRTIVSDLTRTFPNCQFIATTHSPQIISSVLPENIQIIKNFEIDQTVKSFGLDINWILKFIMEDGDRLKESEEAIAAVQKLIDEVEFEKARALIEEYKKQNLDLDEWIMFEARMSHLEMFDDEEDN